MCDNEKVGAYRRQEINQPMRLNTCTASMLVEHMNHIFTADEGYRHCVSFRNCGTGGGNYRARSGLGRQRLQWPSISRLGG
jgi:hypothetical protein